MATITSTPTAGSLTISGTNKVSGTISWSAPTVPSGAIITSCILTGTATANMSKGSAKITVNGSSVTSGVTFTVNLGTANNTTSVTTTATGGNKNSAGTVTFSNLVYTVTYEEPGQVQTYTVTFVDWNGTILKTQEVEQGSSATAPSNPSRDGYNFTGWDKTFNNITADTTITAQYSIKTYTVIFKDYDGTTLKTQTVNHGSAATAPNNPTREGYTFTGWDVAFTNVTSNLTVTAQYEQNEESNIQNLIIGDITLNELFIGEQEIKEIYLGYMLLFRKMSLDIEYTKIVTLDDIPTFEQSGYINATKTWDFTLPTIEEGLTITNTKLIFDIYIAKGSTVAVNGSISINGTNVLNCTDAVTTTIEVELGTQLMNQITLKATGKSLLHWMRVTISNAKYIIYCE